VELLSGLVFVLVPLHFFNLPMIYAFPVIEAIILSVIWVAAFLVLILISAIDLRFQIIPDFLNGFLALLGFVGIFTLRYFSNFGLAKGGIHGSFLGRYAMLFWVGDSLWLNFFLGAAFGLVLFGGLHLLTRGRGMGMGDAKLAAALGLLLGWPDIVLVSALAFIVGSIVSIFLLVKKKKKAKDQLPFGPFLAAGTALVFFFGYEIVNAYFSLFNL
jgi:prepilin signal peptidase PulO-like enzyme (type II secretory pathway)